MYQNYPLALSTGKLNQPKPKKPLDYLPMNGYKNTRKFVCGSYTSLNKHSRRQQVYNGTRHDV